MAGNMGDNISEITDLVLEASKGTPYILHSIEIVHGRLTIKLRSTKYPEDHAFGKITAELNPTLIFDPDHVAHLFAGLGQVQETLEELHDVKQRTDQGDVPDLGTRRDG